MKNEKEIKWGVGEGECYMSEEYKFYHQKTNQKSFWSKYSFSLT